MCEEGVNAKKNSKTEEKWLIKNGPDRELRKKNRGGN
jgi:hypothetical protein